jgi:hypothetical protein
MENDDLGYMTLRSPTIRRRCPAEIPMDNVDQLAYEQGVIGNRLKWLTLCALNPLPAGRFLPALLGTTIPYPGIGPGVIAQYVEIARNDLSNPIGIAVYGQIDTLGLQVKLSLGDDVGGSLIIDYLGATAAFPSFNKRISCSVILNPAERLYIALQEDPPPAVAGTYSFTPTASDRFVVRVLDPAAYINDGNWETRGQRG